jgi:hypothetical protein
MPPRRYSVEPGQRFGRLVVQRQIHQRRDRGLPRWAAECVCDCGTEVTVLLQNLVPRTRSCGCMKLRGSMSDEFRNSRGQRPRLFRVTAGQRIGRLVVRDEIRNARGVWSARCICDCGSLVTATLTNLKSGSTQSCGCLQREAAARVGAAGTTHCLSKHEHYPRWRNMLARCEDPKNPRYSQWGGRGIKVCAEWHDARAFIGYLEDVLGPRPGGHSLDRIDNDGDYEPGNVRWADDLTQRRNQRRSG